MNPKLEVALMALAIIAYPIKYAIVTVGLFEITHLLTGGMIQGAGLTTVVIGALFGFVVMAWDIRQES